VKAGDCGAVPLEPGPSSAARSTYSELLSPRPDRLTSPGAAGRSGMRRPGFTLVRACSSSCATAVRVMARKAGLIFAFGAGHRCFPVGRMLQGAHFFSHNVWTAVFCWLICLGVVLRSCCIGRQVRQKRCWSERWFLGRTGHLPEGPVGAGCWFETVTLMPFGPIREQATLPHLLKRAKA
jgi:hypothetical protein